MWPFTKVAKKEGTKTRKVMRRLIVGFVIGGAISSIVGSALMKERRKNHLGEDRAE